MLAGVVVATRLGVQATVFYLAVYLLMNLAAFAVIVVRERETGARRRHRVRRRASARSARCWRWPMTLAMLGLAGIPATAGFIGKFYLIDAAVDGGYTWLGVVIVIGSMISLAYYLQVVAAMWMARGAGGRDRVSAHGRASRRWPAAHPRPTPAHRARDVVRRAVLRRRDAVLRDRALAAVQPRRARRPVADRAVLRPSAVATRGPPSAPDASPSVPRSSGAGAGPDRPPRGRRRPRRPPRRPRAELEQLAKAGRDQRLVVGDEDARAHASAGDARTDCRCRRAPPRRARCVQRRCARASDEPMARRRVDLATRPGRRRGPRRPARAARSAARPPRARDRRA